MILRVKIMTVNEDTFFLSQCLCYYADRSKKICFKIILCVRWKKIRHSPRYFFNEYHNMSEIHCYLKFAFRWDNHQRWLCSLTYFTRELFKFLYFNFRVEKRIFFGKRYQLVSNLQRFTENELIVKPKLKRVVVGFL